MSDMPHPNYKKIYVVLLVLLAISVAGPFLGIKWVTLITAFGIALVKARLVVQNFMHLKWEKRVARLVLAGSLILMALFFFAVAPDIMKHRGSNWVNDAALAATARGIAAPHHEGAEGAVGATGESAPEGRVWAGQYFPPAAAPAAPTAATAAFDARSAFTTTCASCHGADGNGDGPAAAALVPGPARFSDPAFWAARRGRDADLVKAIRDGGASVGRSASMPAWGSLFNEEQARALVVYLKTLERK
jgi:caa(3)-type oxidase subunit IV